MFFTMRRGVSTRARSGLLAVLLATSLVAALTAPSFADKKDDLEKQKKEASSEAADAKQDLDESTKEFAAAAAAYTAAQAKLDVATTTLGRTRGKLAAARARDAEMQTKLARSQADLVQARAKLTQAESRLTKSETAVEEFAVQNVQDGDQGLRAFSGLLNGEDPTVYAEQISLNDAISDSQVATMQRLEATRVILRLNRARIKKLRDKVKVQRQAAAANLKEMTRLEAHAEAQAAEVASLVAERRSARYQASKAQVEDERQYQEKVAEANRLAAELRALAATEVRSGGKGTGGDKGGTLSYPVNGPITSPYGMRVHPITGVYKLHDGTDFGVPCGTPVRAAAGGTIIQQYYNGAYGNRVILNNGIKRGVNVVTTYNHLTSFVVATGSKVKRGQLIAYSGTTGYSTGCHLHFMVLVNGETVNPMGWL